LGLQYFFNRHWGLSLAGEYFVFNTQSRYADKSFLFEKQVDNEGHVCDLTIRLKNWKENQTTDFIEIPFMGVFQHKFGRMERHGLYFGLGVKAQIPISYTFERADGDVKVSAYYPQWHLHFEDGWSVEMPQHGYGTNNNRQWNGATNLKTGFAAVGEFGFLFGLSPRVDLTLGISADYGLTDINNKKDNLLGPIDGKTQQDGSFVAEQVYYNGILNSNQISGINTLSLRGKVGLRIKIGKLKPRPIDTLEHFPTGSGERRPPDTIFVYPVVVYTHAPDSVVERPNRGERPSHYDPIPKGVEDTLIESIYFDLDKSNLTAKSKEILDRKAALMKKYPQAVLSVIGHTCNIGSGDYNDKLSYQRAEAARLYLIQKGISPTRVITIPMGKRDPDHINDSDANRSLNRRVDFIIAE
jgi:outer membrane protein OmpA-like peptidoglycan-associated protein